MHVPHFFQKCGAAHYLLWVKHEILEQLELLDREIQLPIANTHHVTQTIE